MALKTPVKRYGTIVRAKTHAHTSPLRDKISVHICVNISVKESIHVSQHAPEANHLELCRSCFFSRSTSHLTAANSTPTTLTFSEEAVDEFL